jgi:protocatechuate 3,4-dioxygenase beta subunit
MLALIAMLAALLQQGPPMGTIEGIVVRSGTTVPIAGVEIRAIPYNDSPLETITDGAGRFVLHDVPAGLVSIEARADGYLFPARLPAEAMIRAAGETEYRTAEGYVVANPVLRFGVTLAAGESLKLAASPAIRASMITGRVVDGDGHGIPGASVALITAITDAAGRGRLLMEMGRAITDERGEYHRDMLSPGDYYVKATIDRPDAATLTVYYPATADSRAAASVVLSEGAEATANISIPAALEANTFKISGRVLPLPASARTSVELLLRTQGPPPAAAANATMDAKTGRFELRNVPPGIYDLFASAAVGDKQHLAKVPVEIRDLDVENLEIVLQPGARVSGRLLLEADSNSLALTQPITRIVRISLNRKDGLFGNILRPVFEDDGGTFAFPDVPPGNYDIRVRFGDGSGAAGADLYVADIRAGGRSVFDSGFEVGIDPTDALEIIIGTNGGTIAGAVTSLSKQPATVILAPELWRARNTSLFRAAAATTDGQFELRGLTPGTYKIFAVPSGTPLSARSEVLSQYEARAVTVVVQKGVALTGIQVPLLSSGQ